MNQGLPVLAAEDVGHAAEGVLDYLGRPVIAVRPGLAEVGNGHHDNVRVDGADGVVAEAERRHDAGAEVLDHHVGLRGQSQGDVPAHPGLEVQGHAALARVQVQERQAHLLVRLIVGERPQAARRVTAARPLDLHDVGAEVGKQLGAVRPGHVVCKVQHANAVEGGLLHGAEHSPGLVYNPAHGLAVGKWSPRAG